MARSLQSDPHALSPHRERRRNLAARHHAILAAARALAAEGGMAAVQIAPVAAARRHRGRHRLSLFPGQDRSRRSPWSRPCPRGDRAPCAEPQTRRRVRCRRWPPPSRPLPRARCADRRLALALIAEPVDPEVDAMRLRYRRALAREFESCIRTAMTGGHLPEQDAALAAPALGRRADRRLDRPARAGRGDDDAGGGARARCRR